MKTVPFWTDDHPRPSDLGNADLPTESEVLVIGSGNTGLSTARELAGLGVAVTVVDAGEIACGASSINGGQVNYGPKGSIRTIYRRLGPALGRRIWDASLAAVDLVEEIVADEAIACDFSRPGTVELAYRRSDLDDLTEESRWMEEHLGSRTEPIPAERMPEVIGSDRFACALVDTTGGSLTLPSSSSGSPPLRGGAEPPWSHTPGSPRSTATLPASLSPPRRAGCGPAR